MSKFPIVFLLILLISSSIIVVGVKLNPTKDYVSEEKFYIFSLLVADNIFVVTVISNYTTAPEVNYFEVMKSVSVDFKGPPENAFCNITIPDDLISGDFSIIDKYYIMSDAYYILSNNSTHNSFYFTFNHIAFTKHFEIIGTE